jgi:hypothetical protein
MRRFELQVLPSESDKVIIWFGESLLAWRGQSGESRDSRQETRKQTKRNIIMLDAGGVLEWWG